MNKLMRTLLLAMMLLLGGITFAQTNAELEVTGLYPDLAANYRVQMIGQRLKLATGLNNLVFKIINDKELNAFALPDGRIYITSRMATEVTDEELAYVMGHEVTHVREHHGEKQANQTTTGMVLGAVLVAALGGSTDDITTGASVAGALTQGHYSRDDENRADTGGVRLMAQLGYDPKLAAKAMQRLIDRYGKGDASVPVIGWFASHPDSGNRLKHINEVADDIIAHPVDIIPTPYNITIELDSSAQHARGWAKDYLAYLLTTYSDGRALSTPGSSVFSIPLAAKVKAPANNAKPTTPGPTGKSTAPATSIEDISAGPVQVRMLDTIPGYAVTLALHEIPAGNASSFSRATGTAVSAVITWRENSTGFTGVCNATAQSSTVVPWQAEQQLGNTAATRLLRDGKKTNIEGTLEGLALQRVARAFGEIVDVRGPVHHVFPVTLARPSDSIRSGDTVAVIRGNYVVAEMSVTALTTDKMTGEVIWGTHTHNNNDKLQRE